MYRIGMFSKLTKTTVKTLRYYDEVGLLHPSYVDPETGYRYYTTGQMLPLHRILSLRQAGFTVAEVSAALSGRKVEALLTARRAELEAQMRDVRETLSRLEFILSRGGEEFFMNYQATIKRIPDYVVYYKRGTVDDYGQIERFVLQSGEECRAANPGIRCVDPDYCFVAYLDGEFRDRDIRLEYCQAVTAAGVETDVIKFRRLEPVDAICVVHKGPFETIREGYVFALDWAQKNGYVPAGDPRECYIDGVWNKEDPAEWLTEIQIPVTRT